jgi:hypothetical protein
MTWLICFYPEKLRRPLRGTPPLDLGARQNYRSILDQLRIFRLAFSNWKMIPHADTIMDLLIIAQLAAPLYFSNGVETKVFWMFTPAIRALQDPDQNRFSGSYRLSRLKIASSLANVQKVSIQIASPVEIGPIHIICATLPFQLSSFTGCIHQAPPSVTSVGTHRHG